MAGSIRDAKEALKIINILHKRNTENALKYKKRMMMLMDLLCRLLQFNLACQAVIVHMLHFGFKLQKQPIKRNLMFVPRSKELWESVIDKWTPNKFISNFRMGRASVNILVTKLHPHLQRRRKGRLPVSVQMQVYVALYCLGSNCLLRTGEHLFGLGLSTVWYIVRRFCKAVIKVMFPVFLPRITSKKADKIAARFLEKYKLPQCIGVVHGTHVKIRAPSVHPTDFYSKYKCYTIAMQAITDADGFFLNAGAGYPGCMHDARIFENSLIGKMLREKGGWGFPPKNYNGFQLPHYLIGDSAYPLKPYLMKGFPDWLNLTNEQRMFNQMLSHARAMIEHSFGVYKGRWQVLLYMNRSTVPTVTQCMLACVALHNFCLAQKEEVLPEWLKDLPEALDNMNCSDDVVFLNDEVNAGHGIREALVKLMI